MKKIFNVPVLIVIASLSVLLSSCEKKYYVAPEEEIKDVSFSNDMQPFFDASCNTAGCHDGSFKPNLLANVSYNELINGSTNSGDKYVDTDNPESSVLYQKIIPGGSMEQHATPTQRTMTLVWIQEGAKDN